MTDNILPFRPYREVAIQNVKSSDGGAPLTLQESTLEADLWRAERLVRHFEENVSGLRKLRHIDAGAQLADWSRRLFRLSFDVK